MRYNSAFKNKYFPGRIYTEEEFLSIKEKTQMLQCPSCRGNKFNVVITSQILIKNTHISNQIQSLSGTPQDYPQVTVQSVTCNSCGREIELLDSEDMESSYCEWCGEIISGPYVECSGVRFHLQCATLLGKEGQIISMDLDDK